MIISTKDIFSRCYGKYGIGAVNVWCMKQIHGLFSTAQKANAPFIVQTTRIARNYANSAMLLSIIMTAAKIYPRTVFTIHLNHGNLKHAFNSIESGVYNSVMIDASHETYEKNVEFTKQVVQKAYEKNISVEAELSILSGVEDDITIDEKHKKLTQPAEVEDFVKQTICDSLAVAVDTSHGAYKFSGKQGIQFNILKEIQIRLPVFPLMIHGGSAINLEEIQCINTAGSQLGTDAKGVSAEELAKTIQYAVYRIKIATDAHLIWTKVHRKFFKLTPHSLTQLLQVKLTWRLLKNLTSKNLNYYMQLEKLMN